MAQSPELVSLYRKISRQLEKLETSIGREKFFGQCLGNKLIPATLRVKPPAVHTSVNAKTKNLYMNAATSSSLRNVYIAHKDAKIETKKANEDFTSFLNTTISESSVEASVIHDYIKRRRPQISRRIQHNFAQKINHLKKKKAMNLHQM